MSHTLRSIVGHGFYGSLLLSAILFTSCASNNKETTEATVEQKKAEIYYGQGTSDLVKKNYSQALINLLKASEYDPKDSQIRNNLGMAYYFREQPALAEKEFKTALDIDPKNSDARVNLGSLYMGLNRDKEARAQFENVQKDLTYTGQFRNYYNLALLSLKSGDRAEAFEYLFRSLKEKEDYCPAHFKLGELYSEEYKYKLALASFNESSKGLCVSEPEPHYQQAVTLMNLGRLEESRSKLKDILEKFPKTKYYNLALLQLKKLSGQIKEQSLSRNDQTEIIKEEKTIETPNF